MMKTTITPVSRDPVIRKILAAGPQKKKAPAVVKTKRAKVWAVDFDGTLCRSAFPGIGAPNNDLIEVLMFCRMQGVKLILWTTRTGKHLDEAVEWCRSQGLTFDAVNENLPEMKDLYGTDPRKIGADLYIDDRAFPYWGRGERGDPCKLIEKV